MTPQSNTETNQKPFPTVHKFTIVQLAEELERIDARLSALGEMNTPLDVEKRVQLRAAIRIATDMRIHAKEQYDRAFDAWARGGYQE